MKKLFFVVLTVIFLSGCGTLAKESEFWEHSSMYKNWDHLWFSWKGHENPSNETAKKAIQQAWWGIPVEYSEIQEGYSE